MIPGAVSPRSPPPPPLPSSPSSSPPQRAPRPGSAARDEALMRLVHTHRPYHAAHGTKGVAWDAVARAMRSQAGVAWQGIVCRNRVGYLLDRYDRHRAGKASSVIAALPPDVLPMLEDALLTVAKTRVEAQLKSKEKALVTAKRTRDETKAERDREAQARALMKERDKTRAAAVVAEAARAREGEPVAKAATVVAKRRKRKGVKTKEQKIASNGMFEALRQSREEYLNQLRVQTAAAAAAAQATDGDETKPPGPKKPLVKAGVDLDLHVLRAVAKCSPYSQETKQSTEEQWVAVTDRVMKYCNLKFTTTALRDRCEALIMDFEAHDCKKSTFGSGVAVADEERLSLLRVIRKAHNRQSRSTVEKTDKSPESSQIEKEDSAIEIEDENDSRDDDGLEQWGSLEENRIEGEIEDEAADEQVDESLVDDTQDEEDPEPSAQRLDDSEEPEKDYSGSVVLPVSKPPTKSSNKRRRSALVASPDADPNVDVDIDQLQVDDNSLDWSESQDFTPRKYKQQRLLDTEQDEKTEGDATAATVDEQRPTQRQTSNQLDASSQFAAVLDLVKAERAERHAEFKAMLDFVKQQNDDRRSEWERDQERRIREQTERQQEMTERQREMTALISLLTKERKDRKSEMLTMLEAMNKDRDIRREEFNADRNDRREEFKAMMGLMKEMLQTRAPGASS